MEGSFIKSYKAIRRNTNLTVYEKPILDTLIAAWEFHKHKDFSFPLNKLASENGMALMTTRRAKDSLVTKGILIQRVRGDNDGRKGTRSYYNIDSGVLKKYMCCDDQRPEEVMLSIVKRYYDELGDLLYSDENVTEIFNRDVLPECGKSYSDINECANEFIKIVKKFKKNGNK